jgi:formate dehydrogenase major subunit
MSIRVDGREAAPFGSVLDTVLALGIDLPHLCKDDHLPAIGACRTCLVLVDGRVAAACSVPADSVTTVDTLDERVVRIRRGVLALTAAMQTEGPAGGPLSGTTAQVLAQAGIAPAPVAEPELVDSSGPFFTFNEAACILCGRCVVACQDLQHISAIGMAGRGRATRVTPGANVSFRESICTSCGSCVAACPTTALAPKGAAS